MTGPLFTENDRWYDPPEYDIPPARIPSGFWKILYYIDKKKSEASGKEVLGCEAYLVYQDELSIRSDDDSKQIKIDTLQVTISELTDLTGIEFPELLYEANPLWYHTKDRDIEEPER